MTESVNKVCAVFTSNEIAKAVERAIKVATKRAQRLAPNMVLEPKQVIKHKRISVPTDHCSRPPCEFFASPDGNRAKENNATTS